MSVKRDRSRPRLLGTPLALHDVRDVEAFVRALLDARLREWGARLRPAEYDDALTYLIERCWELSGLDNAGRPRVAWYIREVDVDELLADGESEGPLHGPFRTEPEALEFAVALGDTELVRGAPKGAYDPAHGIAFSTYSRRILTLRVVDWYRSTMGDARYGTQHRNVSLEAVAAKYERDGEAPEQFLAHMAGADDDQIDEVVLFVSLGL